jgi:transposase InsO family protein
LAQLEPHKLWWTADELVAARLPGLPGTKRGINFKADQDGWRTVPNGARKRQGRGGGWQYHWSVLPQDAQSKLLKDATEIKDERIDRGEAWATYDALKNTVKAKAQTRLEALRSVEALRAANTTLTVAISTVSKEYDVSVRSVHNWLSMVDGIAVEDRLAYLAPRNSMAKRPTTGGRDVMPFMNYLKAQYLRFGPPTFSDSYRKAKKLADKEGLPTLIERTAKRHLERDVPRVSRVYLREGEAGLQRCFPAQIRDRSGMTALEGVNADCHKIDVFVKWPDGTINRPQIVAFQDLYSNKILSWRVDHDPNKVMVMAAFGELIEQWGIPKHCLFDNGKEFANKWLTAGTPTRFRYKVRDDDPLGVLPMLGVKVHWATPAHGQAKPIERGFRDFANDIAKDIRFAGAYVGNRPDRKPEDYGSRAIDIDKFLQVLAEGIVEHNAREGRLSQTAHGRSFDQTFAESYEVVPIQKATQEQRRLWMMGQHVGKLNRNNGQLIFLKNVYHSNWMSQCPSTEVVARFDPEDLHAGVHIYSKPGEYLGFAECQQAVGFFDITGARNQAKRNAQIRKAEKDLAKALNPMSTDEMAAKLNAISPAPAADLDAKVLKPSFGDAHRPQFHQRKHLEPKRDVATEGLREAMVLDMTKDAAKKAAPKIRATPEGRFAEALEIIARSDAGKPIGEATAKWLIAYRETPEFRTAMKMKQLRQDGDVG